jgi:hypothetical protein
MKRLGWRELIRAAGWWFGRRHRLRAVQVEELPDSIEAGTLYVVGEGQHLWSVALQCPCRCRAVIQLNLLPDAEPRWALTKHRDGTITLHPSIWRQMGCRSHFFIRKGQIEWFIPQGTYPAKTGGGNDSVEGTHNPPRREP